MNAFIRFGGGHLLGLAAVLAAAMVAIAAGRHPRASLVARGILSVVLAATLVAFLVSEGARGTLTALDFLPFHLSDFAVLLAIFSLLTLRRRAAELLYFLSIAEILALLTPDVSHGFRSFHTIVFFVLHGGTLVAAVLLTFGLKLPPERGAVVRALLFLHAYACLIALVNAMLDTNFLYLRQKPAQPSPLDWMGPWPWYLITADAVAAVLFSIANAPFWWRRRER